MTLTWMLYAACLSLLAGAAALAAERALAPLRLPTRWLWAVALLVSLAAPLGTGGADRGDGEPGSAVALMAGVDGQAGVDAAAFAGAGPGELSTDFSTDLSKDGSTAVATEVSTAGRGWMGQVNPALPALWAGASLLLLCGLALSAARLALRRRGWRRARVMGVPVLVSARTGPAVVGALRPAIVLPEWLLSWDSTRLRLALAHEAEHLRAADPLLLLLGALGPALMPWNPVLWWQYRRLRLAVEVDCDARVLRAQPDPRGYGRLLLDVGRRASRLPAPSAALSEPRSFLERRIRTMTEPTPGRRARRLCAAAGACALFAVAAAAVPAPAAPALTSLFPAGEHVVSEINAMAGHRLAGVGLGEVRAGDTIPRAERAEVERAIRQAREEMRRANVDMRAAEAEIARAMEEVRLAEPDLRRAREEMRRLRAEMPRIEEEMRRVAADMPRMEEEMRRAVAEMPRMEEEMRRMREEMPRIQEEMRRIELDMPRIEAEIARAALSEAEIERIVAESMPSREEMARMEAEMREVEREMPRIRAEARRAAEEARREMAEARPELERARAAARSASAAAEGARRTTTPLLERHHPRIAQGGTGDDTYVWFLLSADGSVRATGTAPLAAGPWSSESVQREVRARAGGAEIGRILLLRDVETREGSGVRANVALLTLEP